MASIFLGAAIVIGLCFLALTAVTPGQSLVFVLLAVIVSVGLGMRK